MNKYILKTCNSQLATRVLNSAYTSSPKLGFNPPTSNTELSLNEHPQQAPDLHVLDLADTVYCIGVERDERFSCGKVQRVNRRHRRANKSILRKTASAIPATKRNKLKTYSTAAVCQCKGGRGGATDLTRGWKSPKLHCPCGQAKGEAVTLYSYHDDADDVRRSLKSDHRGT